MLASSKAPVTALGGGNDSSSPCNYGGSGTIYFKNESRLLITGPSFALQASILAKTLIQGADPRAEDFQNLSSLVLNRTALATFNISNPDEQSIVASIQSVLVL